MVCGLPASSPSKSVLVRLGISMPCLSFTLKNKFTTLTSALKVWMESSLAGAGVCWLGGGCAGGDCDWAASQTLETRIRDTTAVNLRTGQSNMRFSFPWNFFIVLQTAQC